MLVLIGFIFGLFVILIPFFKSVIRLSRYLNQEHIAINSFQSINSQVLDDLDKDSKSSDMPKVPSWEYPEILFVGIAPIYGIFLTYAFYRDIKPFHIDYAPSLILYILVVYSSYWMSRYYKDKLPVSIVALLPYGIILSFLFYPILIIHFLSPMTLLGGVIFPYLAFPLFAPLPALLYAIREFSILNYFIEKKIEELQEKPEPNFTTYAFASQYRWKADFQSVLIFVCLVLMTQLSLYAFGQPLNSLWLVFRESQGFIFSAKGSIF